MLGNDRVNVDCIDVKTYGWDNGVNRIIDDGRSSIILSTPLSFYGILYVRCTKNVDSYRNPRPKKVSTYRPTPYGTVLEKACYPCLKKGPRKERSYGAVQYSF